MTAPPIDPRTAIPADYMARRGDGFLASTIRRPSADETHHDAEVDRFVGKILKARAAQPAGKLPRPDADTFRRLLAEFVDTECVQQPGADVGKVPLHVAWSSWVRAHGFDPGHMNRLALELKTVVPGLAESRLGREQISRWRGLTLAADGKQGAA